MRSPFPGMDPYLEKSWRDVYASLIVYMRDSLQPQMPVGLRARVEERVSNGRTDAHKSVFRTYGYSMSLSGVRKAFVEPQC